MSEIVSAGKLLTNVKLDRYSTWRVGGCAEKLYIPVDKKDLAQFLSLLPADEPVFFLGLGSNTLIRDGGIRGTVILLSQSNLQAIELVDTHCLYAQAGASCAKLARTAARLGLTGLEFLAGIPGTVGGALMMNAGCHGSETWKHVIACETVDRSGQLHKRLAKDFGIQYRHVTMPGDEYFVSATFHAETGNKESSLATINELLHHRNFTQPINLANGGCVFRNPPGDYAGRLIERCGLKGLSQNDARVSEKHANFIVHQGKATARDIEQLIYQVQKAVLEKTGIELQLETKIVGSTN